MQVTNMVMIVLWQALSLQAQSKQIYVPETSDITAQSIAAFYQMHGTLKPHWSGAALIGVQDNQSSGPLIYLIGRNGRRDQFSFSTPDNATIYVHDLALSTDGTVAITGGASGTDSRAGAFLAFIAPDQKSQIVISTWPYVGWQGVFVPDGSLWTVGYTFHPTEDKIVRQTVMAHYDSAGKMLMGREVKAKGRFWPGRHAADESFLRVSSDRMGWFTNGMEYIEFSFDGHEVGRYDGPQVPDSVDAMIGASFALSDDNVVIFGRRGAGGGKRSFWALDRAARVWNPVEINDPTLPSGSDLLGFSQGALVLTGKSQEMRFYKRDSLNPPAQDR